METLCLTRISRDGIAWVCLKPTHDKGEAHLFEPAGNAIPATSEPPVLTCTLLCHSPDCGAERTYKLTALRVSLYSHGVCAASFFCLSCKEMTEFILSDEAAMALDAAGAATTIVHTPAEVTEWPAGQVPAIQEFDVGILERSSLRHFNECAWRELGQRAEGESGG